MPEESNIERLVVSGRNRKLPSTIQDGSEEKMESVKIPVVTRLGKFYNNNEFLILMTVVLVLARAYPTLGAQYLAPDITASWLAVCAIFLMAGLGLKTEEFSKAFRRIGFNVFVQVFNFGVVSCIVFGASRGLEASSILSQQLADGMVLSASVPMAINTVLVLTKASNGEEAAAVFSAALGNLIGVFLSPVLILGYLSVKGEVDLFEVCYKLSLRVVLPVAFGQILQKTCPAVVALQEKYRSFFKKAPQYFLLYIIYTVFCQTFEGGSDSSIADVLLMISFQFVLLVFLTTLAWYSLGWGYQDQPKLRVMGVFGCTHKTVAMGVPLINVIYGNDPDVGLYSLPLLIWIPMQTIIGSLLSRKLASYVERREAELKALESIYLVDVEKRPGHENDLESGDVTETSENEYF